VPPVFNIEIEELNPDGNRTDVLVVTFGRLLKGESIVQVRLNNHDTTMRKIEVGMRY